MRKIPPTITAEFVNDVLKPFLEILKKILHDSSESLFKPSQRKEWFGIVLAELCGEVGAPLVGSNNYSTKVCKPCSRKI